MDVWSKRYWSCVGSETGLARGQPHHSDFQYSSLRYLDEGESAEDLPRIGYMATGGFHSFEHRWALGEAFTFHRAIGKARVTQRIYELNQQMKQGLAKMPHITLHTPMSQDLSAGIVCFEVSGIAPDQ